MDTADVVWSGFYHDGRTANREPVRVAIVGDALRLTRPDGSSLRWPVAAVRQSQGAHAREKLRLEHGSDPVESLVVEGIGLAEAIQALVPSAPPTLRGRRGSFRLIAALLLIVAGAGGAYFWGAPVFARWLAPRVPAQWESELGSAMAERIVKSERVCTDSLVVAGVRTVADRLLATVPASAYEFRVFVVRDTLVNAFAAPGGVVVVHTALLRAAASAEELAVVLAHEVQHVLQQHGTRAVIREVPLRLALTLISGDAGIGSAASIGGMLGVLSYRRDDEREADEEGMAMLQAARVDAPAAAKFMRTLARRGGEVPRFATYLSSHPRSELRSDRLEALARAARYEPRPVMDSARWSAVQQGCGGG